jgi:cytochrome c553
MSTLRTVTVSFVLVVCSTGMRSALADDAKAVEKLTSQVCATCHGPGGHSTSPTVPVLAAQSAPYLELQLKAFRDQTRSDPDAQAYMWGMAAQLDDSTIKAVANYYATQTPTKAKEVQSEVISRGKKVFTEGVANLGVPACASCHGDRAQGQAAFPRLAGQHAPYVLKQLLVIQNALRTAPVMHGVVRNLSRDQTQAVAAYVESLGEK